jgi:hypothetical protein
VQKVLAKLQSGLAEASQEIEAARAQADAKRLQQVEAAKRKEVRRTEESKTVIDTAPTEHAAIRKQHLESCGAASSSARQKKLKEWLPEQRKAASALVNHGREAATAGKYDEAAQHYDEAKRMLGGHATRAVPHRITPEEETRPTSLREQWQASYQPEATLDPVPLREVKGKKQSKSAGKNKKKVLGALGKPTKKHKKKQQKRRKMKPIVEEPRRPGCVGWLLGASMKEEDFESDVDDNQSLGSDLCVLGSGLAIAIAGVCLVAKVRANN